jgi:hypothetical protein
MLMNTLFCVQSLVDITRLSFEMRARPTSKDTVSRVALIPSWLSISVCHPLRMCDRVHQDCTVIQARAFLAPGDESAVDLRQWLRENPAPGS